MNAAPETNPSITWLLFAFLTVATWGVYGVLLHLGQLGMNVPGTPDPNARYKAFLFVGVAYFLVAILGPLLVLKVNHATWSFPATGVAWSLIAGVAGAIGAFGVLLAFGAAPGPKPVAYVPVIMSIIFAGAPIVNAFVSLAKDPPANGWSAIPAPFWLGILLAATGGFLVTKFKPAAAPHAAPAPAAAVLEKPAP